jgi:hypothetical protein
MRDTGGIHDRHDTKEHDIKINFSDKVASPRIVVIPYVSTWTAVDVSKCTT